MEKCSQCGKEFQSAEGLTQHVQDSHRISKHETKEQKKEEQKRQKESDARKRDFSRKLKMAVIAIAVIAVISAAYILIASAPHAPVTGRISMDVPSYVPFLGSDSAPINLIEFGDYQCPFCARFYTQTEQQIIDNYVKTNKTRFYFADFAFLGPDSFTLGQGAWCANEQGRYYDYSGYVYAHQGAENSGWGSPAKVKSMAVDMGMNVTAFASCLDSGKYASRVNELTQLGQNAGVRSTPSFLVGNAEKGYAFMRGSLPYSAFQSRLDAELAAS